MSKEAIKTSSFKNKLHIFSHNNIEKTLKASGLLVSIGAAVFAIGAIASSHVIENDIKNQVDQALPMASPTTPTNEINMLIFDSNANKREAQRTEMMNTLRKQRGEIPLRLGELTLAAAMTIPIIDLVGKLFKKTKKNPTKV